MPSILLKDILPLARQESYRMQHYFIGVEHLFIAMLEMKGSLTSRILEENGFNPEYVINAIRLKIGKGIRQQQWSSTPNTPRYQKIMTYAEKFAQENHHPEPEERDLLLAILVEQDSMAVRVLKALKLDVETLAVSAQSHSVTEEVLDLPVKITFHPDLTDTSLSKSVAMILKRMFHGYPHIRIEQRLSGGYSGAQLFVVTPYQMDGIHHAASVVKIGQTDDILDEAQRYDSHVKNTLPPLTARLEDKPIAPENSHYAGIKYTFITGHDEIPRDLRAVIREWGASAIGEWLRNQLYPTFGKIWWMQGRTCRFEAWREYDWLLPPLFTIDFIEPKQTPADSFTLRFPVRRARFMTLQHGDYLTIENFIVHKVDRDQNILTLAIGNASAAEKAYRIKMRGIDLSKNVYYRGEVLESISGRIWETRADQLTMAARDLRPDFDLDEDLIPATSDKMRKIANPLKHYDTLLDWQVNGLTSKTHGDLHLGNIMVGPGNSPFLIDFAHTRDGHTIFDWACLEISVLNEVVMPVAGSDWNAARKVIEYLMQINAGIPLEANNPLAKALQAILEIRQIAQECLGQKGHWAEYYIALTMCALRALSWDNLALGSRRLMFLVAGLSTHELRTSSSTVAGETPSPEDTDVNTAISSGSGSQ